MPMSAVNTIEVTDGNRARTPIPRRGRQSVRAVYDDHDAGG